MDYLERIRLLEEKVEYLQKERNRILEAIELAGNLSNYHISLNRLQDPKLIIQETAERVRRLVEFKTICFYLVNEDDSDFYQEYTDPAVDSVRINQEVLQLIEDKTFSWSLSRNRPVMISSTDKKEQLLLHSMTTSSRTRGMFIGILATPRDDIMDISLLLFSMTIIACSGALESFELYKQIRERNQKLNENIEKIKESSYKIRENEAKYRALFEYAANAIVLYDPVTQCPLEFNERIQELLGYTQGEFKDLKIEEYEIYQTREEISERIEKTCQQGQLSYETLLKRKDGNIRYVIVANRAIVMGGKTYVLSLITDITEQKQMEVDRLRMEKRLQQSQKMESIGTLAGGISHDFNNILTVILGYAELALTDMGRGAESVSPRENIRHLIMAVNRAKKLVRQILTFSRQTGEKREPVNVNEIVGETLSMLRSTIPSHISVEVDIESRYIYILGDTTQVHQIVMNLCTNALQAMGKEPGVLTVEVKKVRLAVISESPQDPLKAGPYAQITVKDTGHGMDAATLERVFDPYFSTKKPGEGTGLGLSVVHGIVKNWNGHISIDSKPDKGTKVNVRVPLLEDPEKINSESGQFILPENEMILL